MPGAQGEGDGKRLNIGCHVVAATRHEALNQAGVFPAAGGSTSGVLPAPTKGLEVAVTETEHGPRAQ